MRTRLASVAILVAAFFAVSVGVGSKRGFSALDSSVGAFTAVRPGSAVHDLARFVTARGVVGFLLPASVLIGVAVWIWTRSLWLAFAPAFVVQISSLMVREAKRHYMVARPAAALHGALAHNPAFPSGHAATTTAFLVVCATLAWNVVASLAVRRMVVALTIVGSAAMGWTRLALGVHWFSDVVAGWCMGAAIGLVGGSLALTFHSLTKKQFPRG